MALIQSYQNVILGIQTLTDTIPNNHLTIIEILGNIPDTWSQMGYLYFLLDDAIFEGKNPIIKNASLRREGFCYIPDHNYPYKIKFIARPWLLNQNLTFSVKQD